MKKLLMVGALFSMMLVSSCASTFVAPDTSDSGFANRMTDKN